MIPSEPIIQDESVRFTTFSATGQLRYAVPEGTTTHAPVLQQEVTATTIHHGRIIKQSTRWIAVRKVVVSEAEWAEAIA